MQKNFFFVFRNPTQKKNRYRKKTPHRKKTSTQKKTTQKKTDTKNLQEIFPNFSRKFPKKFQTFPRNFPKKSKKENSQTSQKLFSKPHFKKLLKNFSKTPSQKKLSETPLLTFLWT